mmetsp:Transcript_50899/g.111489  ORF Transcript_50899/g.111489 Transcript_50899/m.111489 type:complete len:361 (-) Transcript_50899:430-1512(-)
MLSSWSSLRSAFNSLIELRTSLRSFSRSPRSESIFTRLASMPSMVSFNSVFLARKSVSFCVVSSTSLSHQLLWVASAFCSACRRKIIFCSIFCTFSKGLFACFSSLIAVTSDARSLAPNRFSTPLSSATLLSTASGILALCRPTLPACSRSVAGASRTPAAFCKILIAVSMAFISCARVLDLSSHSSARVLQVVEVVDKVSSSLVNVVLVSVMDPWVSASSPSVVVLMPVFLSLAAVAASMAWVWAFWAKSYEFLELISPFSDSNFLPSNSCFNSSKSSIALSPLNSYFLASGTSGWASRAIAFFCCSVVMMSLKTDKTSRACNIAVSLSTFDLPSFKAVMASSTAVIVSSISVCSSRYA